MLAEPIVDSNITLEEALADDPAKPACPPKILAQLQLVTVHHFSFDGKLHRGQILIHEDLAADILEMFELAREQKFPFAKVVPNAHPDYKWDTNKLVFQDNVTGGFGYRVVKDTDKLSMHAYGRAIDINPMQNPYIRFRNNQPVVFPPNIKWDPKTPGTLHKEHPVIQFMESRGWEWGGRWTRRNNVTDYMHLQKPLIQGV